MTQKSSEERPRPRGAAGEGAGICILTETYHPVVGGGETQARALADGLTARGWRVMIVTRRSDATSPRSERVGGVEIRRVPFAGRGQLKKWALALTVMPTLVRRRGAYDLMLVSGFRILGIPAALVGRLLKKRCVLKADSLGEMTGEYFHPGLKRLGLGPSFGPFRWFLWIRYRLFRRADAFVAISSPVAEELARAGVGPQAVARIPNCVDVERFRPSTAEEKAELRLRLKLPRDRPIVVFTGRLVSYKGLPGLLEAWRGIAPTRPALLLLVGGGGMDIHNCEDQLREFVREHRLGHSVRFAGEVDNVDEYLRAADVFVFPTEHEAFGISLIEAMACGLPVVSTTVGGAGDLLRHEQNGLAVEAADVQGLRGGLHRLLSDAALARRLGAAARRTAVEEFSVARVAEQYAELGERLRVREASGA